jgi:hypothetical protein
MRTLLTGLTILIFVASPLMAAADQCEEVDDWVRAGPVALGNVHIDRAALDFQGARIVGCLKNEGEGTLSQVMLEFDSITERGGGGFSTNLRLDGLASGDMMEFRTDQRSRDLETYERFGVTGYRFRGVNVLIDGESGRPEFDTEDELELDRMLVDRPEHPLEADCAATNSAEGEGDIWISEARLETVGMPGTVNVIGCVTNRGDETIADGMRHNIAVSWEGRAGDEPERLGMVGGMSRLTVPGPLEPGESSLFVSDFDFEQRIIDIEVYPASFDYSGETTDVIEHGPRVKLEQGR